MGSGGTLPGGSKGRSLQLGLFVVNIFVLIVAILAIAFGLITGDRSYWVLFDEFDYPLLAVIILLAGGAVGVILSILGCCAAHNESKCLLIVYFIFAVLLSILFFAGGILGFLFLAKDTKTLDAGMLKSARSYDVNDDDDSYTISWDSAQEELECCGILSYLDWASSVPSAFSGSIRVPESCCMMNPSGKKKYDCESNQSTSQTYTEGCYLVALYNARTDSIIVGSIGIAGGIIVFVGAILAILLNQEMVNNADDYY